MMRSATKSYTWSSSIFCFFSFCQMLYRRLMRPSMATNGTCASASFASIVAFSPSIRLSADRRLASTRPRSDSNAFGSRYRKHSSSSSFFTLLIPSRLAMGA